MLGEHPGDVVVDHHHLVDVLVPLLREHADRRGSAPHAHPLLDDPVDDRRLARLQHELGPLVDRELRRLAAAEREQRLHRHQPSRFDAAGEVVHAAEREHLRPVLAGRDVADGLARGPDELSLGADVAIGVDLHVDAAVAEDRLGHHRHRVDPCDVDETMNGAGL